MIVLIPVDALAVWVGYRLLRVTFWDGPVPFAWLLHDWRERRARARDTRLRQNAGASSAEDMSSTKERDR